LTHVTQPRGWRAARVASSRRRGGRRSPGERRGAPRTRPAQYAGEHQPACSRIHHRVERELLRVTGAHFSGVVADHLPDRLRVHRRLDARARRESGLRLYVDRQPGRTWANRFDWARQAAHDLRRRAPHRRTVPVRQLRP